MPSNMRILCRRQWSLFLPLALAACFIAITEAAKATAVNEATVGPKVVSMLEPVASVKIVDLHKLLTLEPINAQLEALPTGALVRDALLHLPQQTEPDELAEKLAGLVAAGYPGGVAAYNLAVEKALASQTPEKEFNAAHLVNAYEEANQSAEELLEHYGAHLAKARAEGNLSPEDPGAYQNLGTLGQFVARNTDLAASYASLVRSFDGQQLQPQIHVIEHGDVGNLLEDPNRHFHIVVFFIGANGDGSSDLAHINRIAPDFEPRLREALPKPGVADVVPTQEPHGGNFKDVMLFPFNPGDSMKIAAHLALQAAAGRGARSVLLIFPSGTSNALPTLMVSGAKAFNHDQESVVPTFLGHVFLAAYNATQSAALQQALHPQRITIVPSSSKPESTPDAGSPPPGSDPLARPASNDAAPAGAEKPSKKLRSIPLVKGANAPGEEPAATAQPKKSKLSALKFW